MSLFQSGKLLFQHTSLFSGSTSLIPPVVPAVNLLQDCLHTPGLFVGSIPACCASLQPGKAPRNAAQLQQLLAATAPVRWALDTGLHLPGHVTGHQVTAALLLLLQQLPESFIPADVSVMLMHCVPPPPACTSLLSDAMSVVEWATLRHLLALFRAALGPAAAAGNGLTTFSLAAVLAEFLFGDSAAGETPHKPDGHCSIGVCCGVAGNWCGDKGATGFTTDALPAARWQLKLCSGDAGSGSISSFLQWFLFITHVCTAGSVQTAHCKDMAPVVSFSLPLVLAGNGFVCRHILTAFVRLHGCSASRADCQPCGVYHDTAGPRGGSSGGSAAGGSSSKSSSKLGHAAPTCSPSESAGHVSSTAANSGARREPYMSGRIRERTSTAAQVVHQRCAASGSRLQSHKLKLGPVSRDLSAGINVAVTAGIAQERVRQLGQG